MATQKVKVKVKKRKLKVKRLLLFTLIIILLGLTIYDIIKLPIKNIYIVGNTNIPDNEIIDNAGLSNYPSFIKTTSIGIKKKLLTNEYIEKIEIKKTYNRKIYLYITEYKYLCKYNNKIILSNGKIIDDKYDASYLPILLNDISNIEKEFIKGFTKLDDNILLKISEIEYNPVELDNERFILSMIDGNYVYITLSKIDNLNKYNDIISKLDNKKGIIYLDSGNYFEEFKENA